ncbi:MAG: hypothetical protein LC647_06125 [Beggiatoa sp.]|nr:hypothetical protein [Beggiatoa sp.]
MSLDRSGAQHVQSRLMRESLVDRNLLARTESQVSAILPDANVIQIGGRSIMDRGRSALLPLLDEIVANQPEHQMIIGVGAGVRSRHIFSIGLDLGLPTGALAALCAKDAAQNAYMVSCLLAKHGFLYLEAPFVVQTASRHAGGSAGRRVQRYPAIFAVGASAVRGQVAAPWQ